MRGEKNRCCNNLCVFRPERAGGLRPWQVQSLRRGHNPHGEAEPTKASNLDIHNDNENDNDIAIDSDNSDDNDNDDDKNDDNENDNDNDGLENLKKNKMRKKHSVFTLVVFQSDYCGFHQPLLRPPVPTHIASLFHANIRHKQCGSFFRPNLVLPRDRHVHKSECG